jgi:hypothetical protein
MDSNLSGHQTDTGTGEPAAHLGLLLRLLDPGKKLKQPQTPITADCAADKLQELQHMALKVQALHHHCHQVNTESLLPAS